MAANSKKLLLKIKLKKRLETEKVQCETLLIRYGKYIAVRGNNFRKDIMSIYRAFKQLLDLSNLDPQGYCVEQYASDKEAVTCMIRLDE